MSARYHFVTRWRIRGTANEIFEVISRPLQFPRWWSSVYLSVELTEAGEPDGMGLRVRVHTKGWLPYTLDWEALTVEIQAPNVLTISASGDFEGRGAWSVVQDDEFADVTFDWNISAEKPLLRYASFALRPVFEFNHRWAMDEGRRGLERELARRRAGLPEQGLPE